MSPPDPAFREQKTDVLLGGDRAAAAVNQAAGNRGGVNRGAVNPAAEPSIDDLTWELRGRQRAQWAQGTPIGFEQLLSEHPQLAAAVESQLDLIFHEYLLREESGENVAVDEFVQRFPEHAGALRMQIAFHRAVHASTLVDDAPLLADVEAPLENVADVAFPGYEVLDEVGYGGSGVLYRARQIQTNRIVALKVLSAGSHAGSTQRARFRSEAELIARLQHPNIVQIFEAGEYHSCPYLVLEYVAGGNLRDRLNGTPQSPRAAAELLLTLAQGLAAAHAAGIIHRDVTPANILFSTPATPENLLAGVPKITDFGLAKSLRPDDATNAVERTAAGDVFGTPSYMSPEQAAGQIDNLGPATDVYSLGAVLYELLTGRPPFRAVNAVETLQLVVSAEPVAPSRFQPGQPRDLETICLKCLQKRPEQRYPSVSDLVDDLRRFLADEPILARPIGWGTRTWRFCRKRPLLVSLISMVALLLVVISTGSVMFAVRFNQAAQERQAEAKLAEARVHRLENQLGRSFQSLEAIASVARIRQTPEVRDEAIAAMALFDLKPGRHIPLQANGELLLDFDFDLVCAAFRNAQGEIIVRELSGNRELVRFHHEQPISTAVFSPGRRYLALRWNDSPEVEVWWIGDNHPRRVVVDQCLTSWGIGAIDFNPESTKVLIATPNSVVRCWSLPDGVQLWEQQLNEPVYHIACRPGGEQAAIAGKKGVQIRSCDDGRLLLQLDSESACEFVAWHPRGSFLAVNEEVGSIAVWEPDRLRKQAVLPGHSTGGVITAFNHSGSLMFSTSWDGSLKIWDPHWGKLLLSAIGSPAYRLKFSADDREWVGEIEKSSTRSWQFDREPALRRLTPEASFDLGYMRMVAISGAGSARGRLLAVAMERGVGFWDLTTGRPIGSLPIGAVSDLAFDDQGNLIVADNRRINFWPVQVDPANSTKLKFGPPRFIADVGTDSQISISANGSAIGLSWRDDGGVVVRRRRSTDSDSETTSVVRLTPHADVRSIALSPDGRWAITGSHNQTRVCIWDAERGELVRGLAMSGSRVAFSPRGDKFLTTANGVEVWSIDRCESIWKGEGSALAAHAFSPDGQFVAADAGTGRIVIHAVDDGGIVAQLEDPHPTVLHCLTYSADGRWLAAVSRDLKQLSVWDLHSLARRLHQLGIACELPLQFDSEEAPQPLSVEFIQESAADRLQAELEECRRILAEQPRNAGWLVRQGDLLVRAGDDEAARESFATAVGLQPYLYTWLRLVSCQSRLGRWSEMFASLESIQKMENLPAADAALQANGWAWYSSLAPKEIRDDERALKSVHRALELQPSSNDFLNTLGMVLYRKQEYASAIETFKMTLRGSAQPELDLYLLALCHQARGDFSMAADYASRAEYLYEVRGAESARQTQFEFLKFRREYQELRGGDPRQGL